MAGHFFHQNLFLSKQRAYVSITCMLCTGKNLGQNREKMSLVRQRNAWMLLQISFYLNTLPHHSLFRAECLLYITLWWVCYFLFAGRKERLALNPIACSIPKIFIFKQGLTLLFCCLFLFFIFLLCEVFLPRYLL